MINVKLVRPIPTYDDEREVTRTEVVEVVDVNKPSKGKQIDMFR